MRIGGGLQDAGEGLVCAPLEDARADHALRNREHDGCKQREKKQRSDDLADCLADARGGFGFPAYVEFVALCWVHAC